MKKYFYDYLGIMGSGMCLIHCLAMPVLFFVQSYFARDFLKELDLENVYLDYLFVLLCFFAVFSTTQHSDWRYINISFWLFFLLFSISILFEEDFEYLNFLGYGVSLGDIEVLLGNNYDRSTIFRTLETLSEASILEKLWMQKA